MARFSIVCGLPVNTELTFVDMNKMIVSPGRQLARQRTRQQCGGAGENRLDKSVVVQVRLD